MITVKCAICGSQHSNIMSPVCKRCEEDHRRKVMSALELSIAFINREIGFSELKAAQSIFERRA